ncbi:MAG: tyrosine--tRNA ligase, partial [bacterium]
RFGSSGSIRVNELFYPFLQGYDSVALKADVELGGTDQTFNITFGRDMQRYYQQEPQVAITMPILVGLDGKDKMSKSLGNYISINDTPQTMYHKLYNIHDDIVWNYFELLTSEDMNKIEEMRKLVSAGALDPRIVKEKLAMNIVQQYHGADKAKEACMHEKHVHEGLQVPDDIPVFKCGKDKVWIVELLVKSGLCKSNSDARRLIKGGGISADQKKITDADDEISIGTGILLKLGKRKYIKVIV